jgi:formate dehydrogenase subunit gamma
MTTRKVAGSRHRLIPGVLLFLFLLGGVAYWQAAGSDLSNPHANFWRTVRQGLPGFSTVTSAGHKVLIENSGENWREIRNNLILRGSQWVPGLALLAMVLFYLYVGQDKLEKPRSGIRIERYSRGERILHWYTAAMFMLMAVTGLSLLLGRLALIPLFGHGAVSGYLSLAKTLHNYGGPLLLIGLLLEILIWLRYNIPQKSDLTWFKTLGGMFGSGPRPHVGRVNGGEKGWFWLVFLFGLTSGITGLIMDFPLFGQTRLTMQIAHVVHATVGILFLTASFGHIYIGTIGAEGTFEGMWTGSVDAVWAEQHNDLWWAEKMSAAGESPEISRT